MMTQTFAIGLAQRLDIEFAGNQPNHIRKQVDLVGTGGIREDIFFQEGSIGMFRLKFQHLMFGRDVQRKFFETAAAFIHHGGARFDSRQLDRPISSV
jgi:hypothetical protein